jgi:predicted RND superfamily exporter protein
MRANEPKPAHSFERLDHFFGKLAGFSFDHRWWMVALSILLLLGCLALASKARINNGFESFFDANDTTYLTYDEFREDFGSDEISYILYEAPNHEFGPFNIEIMQRIIELTEALEEEVPFVYQVRSLANVELMIGNDDGIEILELQDLFPLSQEELIDLRPAYLGKEMLVGGILSEDAKYAAIIVEMDRSSTDSLEDIRLDPEGGDGIANLYPQVTDAAITEILAREEYSGITFLHSGDVPLNAIFNVVIGDESAFLQGVTAFLISLILLFFFRSFVGVFAPLLVIQISVIATVAFVVVLGWDLDLSFGSIPTLITAIGVAHSVHILSEFRGLFSKIGDRRQALVETLRLVGTPCLLTSITTAVGFASMSFVPIKSIAHMGAYSAFGVLVAFLLSLTMLLAALSFGRTHPRRAMNDAIPREGSEGDTLHGVLDAIYHFVLKRRREILWISFLILTIAVAGILRLVVDSNWLNDLSDRIPLKAHTIQVDEVMGGAMNLILLFDGGSPDSIKDPAVLGDIARVQEWANQQELVRKSYSIADVIKDLNQSFHADDPSFHQIPETRELIAQYLILYEGAGGVEVDEYVSSDYQRASLELRLQLRMMSHTAGLVEDLEAELARNPLRASTISLTGMGALWLKLLDQIVVSQIQGFLIAFSAITLLMCLLLASVKTGLLSMLPNLVPVLLTLGIMGWMVIPLDYSKASIAAVAMGIAVDDTIHLISRFRYEFLRCGNYARALELALFDVGRALVITSIALVCGFLVLTLSLLDSQATQGVLLSTTIIVALLGDFLLLPALILTFKPFGDEAPEEVSHVAPPAI